MSMSRLLLPLALAAFASRALAASPFDGTWKTDLTRMKFSATPDSFVLSGGSFTCQSCLPPFTVPADGAFHAITGHPYTDAVAVRIVDPNTVTVSYRKDGKVTGTRTETVSADGKTLSETSIGHSQVNGVEVKGASTSTRAAPAPAGAHPISGSWQPLAVQSASDSGTMQTFKVTGDRLALSLPTGESYDATFGGPPVLQKGDPGKTMIAVTRPSANHIIETDTRDGKTVGIYDMTVAPDGKHLTMIVTDPRNGQVVTVPMIKQ